MPDIRERIETAVDKEYDMEFAAILMLLMVVFMSYQVFARTFGFSSVWVPEMSRLLNLFIVFFLLARIQLKREHIKIEYFFDKFPERVQTALDVFTDALIVGVAFVVAISSLVYMIEFSHVRTPGAGIPTPVLFFPAFVGFLAYGLVHARDLIQRLQSLVDSVRGRLDILGS